MIFTRHAIERYRQFHMLDQPTATDEDARQILERFGPTATRLAHKTNSGDPIWRIEALDVELVAKNENGTVTCVTVLPPLRFRGLTPLQAEAVEESARGAKERAAAAERELTDARSAVARARTETKEAKRAAAAKAAEATTRKASAAQAQRDLAERVNAAKNEVTLAIVERDILLSTLKTMRQQIAREHDATRYKAALRIAVRALRDVGATEALAAIAAVEPGLASDAFANGVDS